MNEPIPPSTQITDVHLKALKAEIQGETTKSLQSLENHVTSQINQIQGTVMSLHDEMLKWMQVVTPNFALPPPPPSLAPSNSNSGP